MNRLIVATAILLLGVQLTLAADTNVPALPISSGATGKPVVQGASARTADKKKNAVCKRDGLAKGLKDVALKRFISECRRS